MMTAWPNFKKKLQQMFYGEVQKEINRIVSHYGKEKDVNGNFDLESFEMSIFRTVWHGIGKQKYLKHF